MKDGGPAFPVKGGMFFMAPPGTEEQYALLKKGVETGYSGMSMRDWFAGQALSRMIVQGEGSLVDTMTAIWAYGMADAMIAERDKEAE